jgi:hypothetical protein
MSSNWYADPLLDSDLGCSSCLHRHVVVVTTGSRRLVAGEIVDDIVERLQCQDCMEFVTEIDVRAAWLGEDLRSPVDESGGNDDVDF